MTTSHRDDEASQARGDDGHDRLAEAYEVLRARCPDVPEHLREDVIQEAALRMAKAYPRWRDLPTIEGICRRALTRAYASILERMSRQELQLDEGMEALLDAGDPTGSHARGIDVDWVLSFMSPDDQALIREELRGMSVPDIVASRREQGRPATTRAVESRLRRARERFAALARTHGLAVLVVSTLLTSFLVSSSCVQLVGAQGPSSASTMTKPRASDISRRSFASRPV